MQPGSMIAYGATRGQKCKGACFSLSAPTPFPFIIGKRSCLSHRNASPAIKHISFFYPTLNGSIACFTHTKKRLACVTYNAEERTYIEISILLLTTYVLGNQLMAERKGDLMPRNERLRQQRILRNWRQQDVADQLGVSLVTMQRWERGSQHPGAYYRVKLCALFGLSAQELGLLEEFPAPASPESETEEIAGIEGIEETAPSEAASTQELALWTIPYVRNPHFTGRDDLLDHLMQQLSPAQSEQAETIRQAALTQSHVIKGLGGIGKTQIAVEYAYRAREQGRYVHTLWINAASEEALLTCFSALADFLPAFPSKEETDQRQLAAAV